MVAKLSREQRREQLLDTGLTIVRNEGADQLTLATLAIGAQVSRPIAYEHFETRTGLLLALYQRLEQRYVEMLKRTLNGSVHENLPALARALSQSYFGCLESTGPEGPALSAALLGTSEMAAHQRASHHEYAEIMREALQRYSGLPESELRLRCVGLLGAAESIARERQAGALSLEQAESAFAALIEGGVLTGRSSP